MNTYKETSRDDFEKALEIIVNETVTAKELAEILDVSKSTICGWTQSKRFPTGSVWEFGSTRRYVLSRILRAGFTQYTNRRKV